MCLEGDISKSSIMNSLSRGKRASGDLIPWTVSQQFNDHDFAGLSGGRIVRIATHPDFQGVCLLTIVPPLIFFPFSTLFVFVILLNLLPEKTWVENCGNVKQCTFFFVLLPQTKHYITASGCRAVAFESFHLFVPHAKAQ